MSASTSEPRRIRRAYLWIVAVVLLLFALLTGAWLYAANWIDQQAGLAIERAARSGVAIGCPNRDVTGYPFRIGLTCEAVTVDAPADEFRMNGGAFRSAAQLYRPNRLVTELDGPVIIDASGAPPLDLRWDLFQASVSAWSEGLDRFSVHVDRPSFATVAPAASRKPFFEAVSGEVHGRRRESDLDLALRTTGGHLSRGTGVELPPFDIFADVTIDGAADWLSGGAAGQSARELFAGRSGTLRSVSINLSDGSAQATGADGQNGGAELVGDFAFSEDGRLSGAFDLALSKPDEVAQSVSNAIPEVADTARQIASVIPYLGKKDDKGRTVIRLTADDGRLSAGLIPLGEIPPLQ
ncbi:MAG: DUF2125 domain-containing protein [Fulvimarina manganoxydans]|uniref:DUF2125 domain-containing protein n=1 Tax=Fulvimarina manganoxydans TaxID=937218 RepID=UPI002355D9C3|nr:DUF2125 domain-containing protein [Fulvimarina manganoxydans]MCK5934328.1 DUF2125 domain-containing protein [Fulvimarina manganoxydans]